MAKNPWIAGVANFFLLGPGYIYNGKRMFLGIFLTIGAILATIVEQVMLEMGSTEFIVLFAGFFSLAVGCAYDGFQEAKSIE